MQARCRVAQKHHSTVNVIACESRAPQRSLYRMHEHVLHWRHVCQKIVALWWMCFNAALLANNAHALLAHVLFAQDPA